MLHLLSLLQREGRQVISCYPPWARNLTLQPSASFAKLCICDPLSSSQLQLIFQQNFSLQALSQLCGILALIFDPYPCFYYLSPVQLYSNFQLPYRLLTPKNWAVLTKLTGFGNASPQRDQPDAISWGWTTSQSSNHLQVFSNCQC